MYCKALTLKMLVFWISRRLREVVAHRGTTFFLMSLSLNILQREISYHDVNREWYSFVVTFKYLLSDLDRSLYSRASLFSLASRIESSYGSQPH